MSKPRPGVAASKRLSGCTDAEIWSQVEKEYPGVVPRVKGLEDTVEKYSRLGTFLQGSKTKTKTATKDFLSKNELLAVVGWKFSVGKPRHALMKHLVSNTEASVREHSKAAIAKARGIDSSSTNNGTSSNDKTKSLQDLLNLKGVGPATASAVLSLVRPDVFAYMYDEVIECFLPKRAYTLPTYAKVNEGCTGIAERLGEGWTPSRVATVLWTAARASAYGLQDHTLALSSNRSKSNTKRPAADDEEPPSTTNIDDDKNKTKDRATRTSKRLRRKL